MATIIKMREEVNEGCILCPICNGYGQIDEPRGLPRSVTEMRKEMAHKLKDKGFSFREIMRFFNFKSTKSVSDLLK